MSSVEEIMAKALKTEEETTYLGQPVILKVLNYKEDIVVSALVNEVLEESQKLGLSREAINHATFITRVLAMLKLSMHKYLDEKKRECVQVFGNMDEISKAANKDFPELVKLFLLYNTTMELTKEEKKS